MNGDDFRDDVVLSEAQFREVIERATRADIRDDGVSVGVLRQVAQELEIDPVALQQALGDVVGVPDTSRPVRSWLRRQLVTVGRVLDFVLPKRGRLAAGILLGTFAGWLTAHVAVGLRLVAGGVSGSIGSSSFIDVPVFILLASLTLANSLSRRLDGRFGRYLAEAATMWAAFAAAWMITFGHATSDLALTTLCTIVSAAAWGWLVVRRTNGPRASSPVQVASRGASARAISDVGREGTAECSPVRRLIALIAPGHSLRHAGRFQGVLPTGAS